MKHKTIKECSSGTVSEKYDSKIKYKALYVPYLLLLLAAPYIAGPIAMLNERRLTRWGWLPHYENAQTKEIELKV
tara:strand:- start:362 stop:586 length:225 start_codon:yes stop_codon:yes gene_type:complete